MRPDPYLAFCVCGRAHRSTTLGGVTRWRDWHQREGCEGCDHVVMISYEPHPRGGAPQGEGHARFSTRGLSTRGLEG